MKKSKNKPDQNLKLQILIGLIGLLASACSQHEHPQATLLDHHGKSGDISHTAETRIVHVLDTDAGYEFCAEPVPDVGEAKVSEGSLDISFLNFFQDAETQDSMSQGMEDIPLVGRTAYILLTRDLGYRLCEAGLGMDWSYDQYFALYQKNIALIKKIAKKEANNSQYNFAIKSKMNFSEGLSVSESETQKNISTADRIKNTQSLKNLLVEPQPTPGSTTPIPGSTTPVP